MRAKHGIKADGTFQDGAIEAFGDFVMNIHSDQAQERPHFFFSETAYVEAELCKRRDIFEVLGAKSWWRFVEESPEKVGKTRHAFVELAITFCITLFGTRHGIALNANVLTIVIEGDSGHVL